MKILEPGLLGGLALANRLVLAAMSRMQANADGTVSSSMPEYYARYAREGVGLLMTEAIYADAQSGRAYFNQPGMADDRQAASWEAVVEAVHRAGGRIFAQFQHGGRLCEPGLNPLHLGASDGAATGNTWQTGVPNAVARAATQDEIGMIVERFRDATARAAWLGFDGIEIHGARGYLLDDFLSASSNRREDEYGRTLAGRMKLSVDVIRAVKSVARSFPVSFNFSLYKMDDSRYQPPGGAEEVAAIARALVEAGADILHLTTRKATRTESWGLSFARTVRDAVPGVDLIVNGGIADLGQADQVLIETGAQAVSLARPLLTNPDLIRRYQAGDVLRSYSPGDERRPLLDVPV
jgi:2,4-dienoyl-CoA reductase-like NADH-dependent reductase (Old Yellow Enzyme family)